MSASATQVARELAEKIAARNEQRVEHLSLDHADTFEGKLTARVSVRLVRDPAYPFSPVTELFIETTEQE